MEKILGYDYDEKIGELVVNEKEAYIVKIIFELKANYNLRDDEIFSLIKNDLSLDQIINFIIFNIQNILSFDYDTKIDFGNVLEILANNDNVEKNLVTPLLKIKESMEKEYKKDLIDKIDEVIRLLQDKSDLLTKFNIFDGINEIINRLNITEESFECNININNDKNYLSKGKYEPIISKELWEKAKERLNHSINELEMDEIDK